MPPPYDDPPTVHEGLAVFMLCFNECREEQDYSPDFIRKIKRAHIKEWAREYGFTDDPDFLEDLIFYVKALDDAWVPLELARRRREQAKAAKANKGKANDNAKQLRKETEGSSQRPSRAKQSS